MRWIGIDYGDTYLGVAVSNNTNTMSVPLAVILTADFQKHLEALILDNDIQGFIVGLPLHLSGHEGELAAKSRAFGTQLEEIFELKVFYEDERLTTKQSEYSHRKKGERTDDIAASIILQQFLDRGV